MGKYLVFIASIILLLSTNIAQGQTSERPLVLPFAEPAGAGTWLLGQPYGNTTGAYNFGQAWYSAGQGLHFGLDFSAPCGTELIAMADGIVVFVDNLSFGSRPHNLIIRHEQIGVTILYGHLLETPQLVAGQFVRQGEVVAKSGDPDETCVSRPHLHLEVRSLDYRSTYNPVDYIDADWHTLSLIGSYSRPTFQQNLDNARQWMSLDDQPIVAFGGQQLNAYNAIYPPANNQRPPTNPTRARMLTPLTPDAIGTATSIGYDQCCQTFWWDETDSNTLYTIDGVQGQRAMVMRWDASSLSLTNEVASTPPLSHSGDGSNTIRMENTQAVITRPDGSEWRINTEGIMPGLNMDNTRAIWTVQAPTLPGQNASLATVYLATPDGIVTPILNEVGISARWLDNHRLLLAINQRPFTRYDVYDIQTQSRYTLGTWYRIRDVSVAPGGMRLMFYLSSQPDSAQNGVYTLEINEGAAPQRMDWFGAWRWRDSESVFYIPFNTADGYHRIHYQHVVDGTSFALNTPAIKIMNGYWEVNEAGTAIAFHHLANRNLWLMTIE